jgi:hypothetical protein
MPDAAVIGTYPWHGFPNHALRRRGEARNATSATDSVASDRSTFRTTFRETLSSRQSALIVFF